MYRAIAVVHRQLQVFTQVFEGKGGKRAWALVLISELYSRSESLGGCDSIWSLTRWVLRLNNMTPEILV